MGKKNRSKATTALKRELARAGAHHDFTAGEEAWQDEVEDIFKDTHPWCRCDKLSNVVLWLSIFALIYWTVAGRFGYGE